MTHEATAAPLLDAALAGLAQTSRLLVCCDFDGTISVLADEPGAARPVDGAIAVLGELSLLPSTWAAVVSGRALIDLTRLAGMPDTVHLVGSHGTEFEVGRIVAVSPSDSALLDTVTQACRTLAAEIDGVLIEVKPASVAVHVRRADRAQGELLLAAVRSGPAALPGVHVMEGKQVIELAVFPGSKADGVQTLRRRWDVTGVLVVGDDVTDESAFAALDPQDVGIKVGEGDTLAPWRLPDPASVVAVLRQLVALRTRAVRVDPSPLAGQTPSAPAGAADGATDMSRPSLS